MEPGIHTARMEVLPVPLVAAHCTLRPVKAEARATMGARMEVLRAAIVLVACVVWKSLGGRVREWRRGEARTDLINISLQSHKQTVMTRVQPKKTRGSGLFLHGIGR